MWWNTHIRNIFVSVLRLVSKSPIQCTTRVSDGFTALPGCVYEFKLQCQCLKGSICLSNIPHILNCMDFVAMI